jgi:uncharacterized membrane protein
MTTKNFNAKKVLMSTIAAVVFSFAFTTSAMAEVSAPTKSNVGIRVKTEQKRNVGIRVKTEQKRNVGIRVKTEQNKFEEFIYQILGVRVKVRVK